MPKRDIKNTSIKTIIMMLFIILMLSTSVIGYITYSNWYASAAGSFMEMTNDMNTNIYQEIEDFVNIPLHINEANHKLLEKGIVDINNAAERESFFTGVMKNYVGDTFYSFSYGMENGAYYGARKNIEQVIEIMRNDRNTNGQTWYYSVSEDISANEIVMKSDLFDPRTRDWYKTAKEAKAPVFSSIYKHFVMEDLTLSAAYPIYNKDGNLQGVLGTHIILREMDALLKEITYNKKANAIIIEKNSDALVANSIGVKNFETLKDKSIKRTNISELNHPVILKAYEAYKKTNTLQHQIKMDGDRYFVSIAEYKNAGLDWLVISEIPESVFMTGILDTMKLTFALSILALIASIIIYYLFANRFLKYFDYLIRVTGEFAKGDFSKRAQVSRIDELGKLAIAFNEMADTMSVFVSTLETKVEERTMALEETNRNLEESKEQLRLLLDSTAEAIYGIDMNGNCTFCNDSCLKFLGYHHQEELIGKNMHKQMHYSYEDGTPMAMETCKIYKSFKTGVGTHVKDEVFWKSDGTCIAVEYHSYPQWKDDKIIGSVVTFMDITETKKTEEQIKYLSTHDSLTGLYNRMFFDKELKRLDTEAQYPISIIFGDLNGLKLTNDIFGHEAGDTLLKKSAEILSRVCRHGDIISRVGGDEFAILLPNTPTEVVQRITERVREEFSKEHIVAIKGSISIGFDTKTSDEQDIERIMKNAEDKMYKEKTLNRKNINDELVSTIIQTLHNRSPREKRHALAVSQLCQDIGHALNLSETDIRKLKEVGYYHDIGKIILEDAMLGKDDELTKSEEDKMIQHPVIGYRILNLFDDTIDLAEGVLNHHENWDGSGYPKGLSGKSIPKLARIIAIAEAYDAMSHTIGENQMSKDDILIEIRKLAGVRFDPDIVEVFINMTSA